MKFCKNNAIRTIPILMRINNFLSHQVKNITNNKIGENWEWERNGIFLIIKFLSKLYKWAYISERKKFFYDEKYKRGLFGYRLQFKNEGKKSKKIKRQLINNHKIKFLPNPLSFYHVYFSARSMNQNTFKTFYIAKKKTLNCGRHVASTS